MKAATDKVAQASQALGAAMYATAQQEGTGRQREQPRLPPMRPRTRSSTPRSSTRATKKPSERIPDIRNEENAGEGVRVSDKRRIDPETYEVREARQRLQEQTTTHWPRKLPRPVPSKVTSTAVEAKVAELTADLQRVHAEYANYRKRVERDREVMQAAAVGAAITELLPVLDDIERAREHGELEGAFKTVGETLESTLTEAGSRAFRRRG